MPLPKLKCRPLLGGWVNYAVSTGARNEQAGVSKTNVMTNQKYCSQTNRLKLFVISTKWTIKESRLLRHSDDLTVQTGAEESLMPRFETVPTG